MKKMLNKAINLLLLLILLSCSNDDVVIKEDRVGPSENIKQEQHISIREIDLKGKIYDGGLKLREYPFLDANMILVIPDGAIVSILSRSKSKQFIEGRSEYWLEVKYNESIGWSWGGYIKVQDHSQAILTDLAIKTEAPLSGFFTGKSWKAFTFENIAINIEQLENSQVKIDIGELKNDEFLLLHTFLNDINDISENEKSLKIENSIQLTNGYPKILNRDNNGVWITYQICLDLLNHYNSTLSISLKYNSVEYVDDYEISKSLIEYEYIDNNYSIKDNKAYEMNLINYNKRESLYTLNTIFLDDVGFKYELDDPFSDEDDIDVDYNENGSIRLTKEIDNGSVKIEMIHLGSLQLGSLFFHQRPEGADFLVKIELDQ